MELCLPLIKRPEVANNNFKGGICDKNGNFVAGMRRNLNNPDANLSCTQAYELPDNIVARHETVVFGGILYGHFGHMISDGLCRLWWFVDHLDTPYKLVFLDIPTQGGFKNYNVLEAAGITRDKMEIITEPTRFDKIIIPEESLSMLSNYRPDMEKIYDHIRSRVEPGPYKKVYLSRTALKNKDTVNEGYFEDFYRRRGYEIVYPEKLPFTEQVSIMAGAEEVVFVAGSLSQLTHFCQPHKAHVVVLNRCGEKVRAINCCLQGKGTDYSIIDAHFNFLPAKHAGGFGGYLLGPTKCWRDYLDKMNIPYEPDEVSLELNLKPFVYDYIVKWGQVYAGKKAYKTIHNASLLDTLEKINSYVLDSSIVRSDYSDRDVVIKLKKQNDELNKKVVILEDVFKKALSEQVDNQPNNLDKNTAMLAENIKIKELQAEIARLQEEKRKLEASFASNSNKLLNKLKSIFKKR